MAVKRIEELTATTAPAGTTVVPVVLTGESEAKQSTLANLGKGLSVVGKVTVTQPATGSTITVVDGATLTASATATVSGTNTGDIAKASGAEVNTGTDDAKFVTAKAMEDSSYAKEAFVTSAVETLASNHDIYGFVDNTETSIGFNVGTYVFTLTCVGANFRYYRNGKLNTVTGNKTVTLPGTPPTADKYYIYMAGDDGALTASTTVWDLTSSTAVPVAVVCFNDTLTPKYCLSDERHTSDWTRSQHAFQHLTQGTRYQSGGAISNYVVAPAVPGDSDNTYQIAETNIWDENLPHTLAELTAENAFEVEYRTGASTWVWGEFDVPFRYTVSGYIQYDNAGTMTEGASGNYYVTYLLATNAAGVHRFVHLHGQAAYATLTAAQNATFSGLTLTGLQYQEAVALWKFIWQTSAAYTTKGKCRLAAEPTKVQLAIQSAGSIPGYGTMAVQNADSVAITGGTMSGVTVLGGTASGDDLTLNSTSDATKGDVFIQSAGGNLKLGGGATASELHLLEPSGGGTSVVGFKAPALAGDNVYTLPTAFPTTGYVLSSTDAGVLSWVALPAAFAWNSSITGTTTDGLTLTVGSGATDAKAAIKLIADNTQSAQPLLANLQLGTSANVMGLLIQGTGSTTGGAAGTGSNHLTLWQDVAGGANKVFSIGNGTSYTEKISFLANGQFELTTDRGSTDGSGTFIAKINNGSSSAAACGKGILWLSNSNEASPMFGLFIDSTTSNVLELDQANNSFRQLYSSQVVTFGSNLSGSGEITNPSVEFKRNWTMNKGGTTITVSAPILKIDSTTTQTSGTLADSGNALLIDHNTFMASTRTWAVAITHNNAASSGVACGIDMSSFSVDEPLFKVVADAVTSPGTLTGQIAIDVGGTTYYVPYYTTGS